MKELFKLQLFAEDGDSTPADSNPSDTDPADQKQDDKKPDNKPDGSKPKYTDKDLDEILSKKFAKWQEKQQKAVDEAKKLAEMNATQKAEYERDQLKKQLDDYKQKDSIAEMAKTARKILSDSGISISDELLSVMVTTDAEKTKAAIDGFSTAFKQAVENAVKERLKGDPPRKGSGGAATMTKEQIMEIKDPELRQKKMLENKELFNF